MKSSPRQPRYRRRFLIQARTAIRALHHVRAQFDERPDSRNPFSQWQALRHGLCLKSASERDARPRAKLQAVELAEEILSRSSSPPQLDLELSRAT